MAPIMATLGLLGGSTWESTVLYYQHINRAVREQVGGFHSAPLVLYSLDFADLERLQVAGEWEAAAELWSDAARKAVAAGAQAVMLCCNTFHIVADQVEHAAGVPLIHIVHATAEKVREQKLKKVILLGTRSTMDSTLYPDCMSEHGVEVILPDEAGKVEINRVIFEELAQGIVKETSRNNYVDIVTSLAKEYGADAMIMGCTEIGMLIKEGDLGMPIFDTCKIHAEKAVEWALAHKDDRPAN